MARTAAIGIQDFGRVIENKCFYVDKTDFIKEWWENEDVVTLITRPRRFGKTLTMSMVEYFFSIRYAGRSDLFKILNIWKEEKYQKIQGSYPVLFISFADVKESSYSQARKKICSIIRELYWQCRFLLDGTILSENEKTAFQSVSPDMEDYEASGSLKALCGYLYRYYGKKVIILLDEYDTPMQEAYLNGFWSELVSFTRGLFNSTFKTNPYLERAVMTGITRVSRESIFSDLNNLEVVTVTSHKYADCFGFTEEEVFAALDEFGLSENMQAVKEWYDGFTFGNRTDIYNPWSILNYLDKSRLSAYWANSSSNSLAGKLIHKSGTAVKMMMEDLLQGKSICASVDEEIIFSDLDLKKSSVWGLLLASGYLKVLGTVKNRKGKIEYELALTNKESVIVFDEMVMGWFSNSRMDYSDFSNALISGNKEYMNEYLNVIATETFSFFDTGMHPSEIRNPENFYHGFVLGLIADLREIYKITSNRESGNGRYDVLLEPYDAQLDDGIILEFKVFDPKTENTLEDTVHKAVKQILDKKYTSVLGKKCSLEKIRVYGFAFRGKEVLVDGGSLV